MKKIIVGTMDIGKQGDIVLIERDIKFSIVLDHDQGLINTSDLIEMLGYQYYFGKNVDIFPKV